VKEKDVNIGEIIAQHNVPISVIKWSGERAVVIILLYVK
jgi:hypothetical protein